jgi:hypothetical protein
LKRIAGAGEEKKAAPTATVPEKDASERGALKDALQSVVAQMPVPQAAAPVPSQPSQATTDKTDRLSSKELERMMRVTVHDVPPV